MFKKSTQFLKIGFSRKQISFDKAKSLHLKKTFQPENSVLEVADFESDFGFYNKSLVSEIFIFYNL